MDKVTWTVSGGGESPPPSDKVEYIPLLRANDKTSDQEKESIRLWNAMVRKLRDHGLMEDKQ